VKLEEAIDECKEEGWMFSFIGAGQDVVEVGRRTDCYQDRHREIDDPS